MIDMRLTANLLILLLLVAGVGWTLYAALALGRPDLTTCQLIYPQMRARPVIAVLSALVAVGIFGAAAPELATWQRLLYLAAITAYGHLVWPQE
jgi:hypothetical protein